MTEELTPEVVPTETVGFEAGFDEDMMEMMYKAARAVVAEMAVSLFQAQIANVYSSGKVNLKRLHNMDESGNIPTDDAESVVLDPSQNLTTGDWVWCLSWQGHALVLGRVVRSGDKRIDDARLKGVNINAAEIGGPGKVA